MPVEDIKLMTPYRSVNEYNLPVTFGKPDNLDLVQGVGYIAKGDVFFVVDKPVVTNTDWNDDWGKGVCTGLELHVVHATKEVVGDLHLYGNLSDISAYFEEVTE